MPPLGASNRLQRLVAKVREVIPDAKIIGFPRGAGTMLPRYAAETGVTAVGLDWMIDPTFCARAGAEPAGRCRAISIPWHWSAGGSALDRAGRSDPGSVLLAGLLSSTSATAIVPEDADRSCRANARSRCDNGGG